MFKRSKVIIGVGCAAIFLFVWSYNLLTNRSLFGPTNPEVSSSTAPQSTSQGVASSNQSRSNSTGAFDVELKTSGERFWVNAKEDDGTRREILVSNAGGSMFSPQQRVSIILSRSYLDNLEVRINNRPAVMTPKQIDKTLVEILITKDNYSQFMR